MSLEVLISHHQDPSLEFGTGEAPTPKTGLSDFGPYSLRLGASHRKQLQLGIVGTPDSIQAAKSFLKRVENGARSGSENLALFPDFPGFTTVFHSTLHAHGSLGSESRLSSSAGSRRGCVSPPRMWCCSRARGQRGARRR